MNLNAICDYCTSNFSKKNQLEDHINKVHPDKFIKCCFCSSVFKKLRYLAKHLKICKFKTLQSNQSSNISKENLIEIDPIITDNNYLNNENEIINDEENKNEDIYLNFVMHQLARSENSDQDLEKFNVHLYLQEKLSKIILDAKYENNATQKLIDGIIIGFNELINCGIELNEVILFSIY
jgi:hypothetical protein